MTVSVSTKMIVSYSNHALIFMLLLLVPHEGVAVANTLRLAAHLTVVGAITTYGALILVPTVNGGCFF